MSLGDCHRSDDVLEDSDADGGEADCAPLLPAVVDGINSLSGQTITLALNATIVAARARETGNDFAPVASAVEEQSSTTTES
ncbi:hypothetical protein GC176_10450 [bacterium]|nr:hypothetical protein [bacterium]